MPDGARQASLDVVLYGDAAAATIAPTLDWLRRLTAGPARALGFVAGSWLAVASVRDRVVGFARAELTPYPFPHGHPRRAAVRALGVDRCDEWLAGGLELVELVVDPSARGRGIGESLQSAVRTPARQRRAWVALAGADLCRLSFYVDRGWVPLTGGRALPADPAALSDPVALLAPVHPAVRSGRLPRGIGPPRVAGRWAPWPPTQ